MNFLSQLENGIFASKKDLEKFSKNENAKILVISDSHGAKETFLSIVQTFGSKADALIFAGDGIFDLLFVIEKAKNHFSTASWLPPVIAFVKGPPEREALFPVSPEVPQPRRRQHFFTAHCRGGRRCPPFFRLAPAVPLLR